VQKHKKRVEHLHRHPPKFEERKWRFERSEEEGSATPLCMKT